MTKRLLDTDILSYYFKGMEKVVKTGNEYLDLFSCFCISSITVFEILSGYKKIKNKQKEDLFLRFCQENEIVSLGQNEVEKAAIIQVELNQSGMSLNIPDIFIASSAIVNDFILVTNNEGHFSRISGLKWENWVKQDIKLI